jgi:hypothetical protein
MFSFSGVAFSIKALPAIWFCWDTISDLLYVAPCVSGAEVREFDTANAM